jgi:hypothetical protein
VTNQILQLGRLPPRGQRLQGSIAIRQSRAQYTRPPPNAARRCPPFKSWTAFRALAPAASFRGRFASLRFRQKIWHAIFFGSKVNFKIFPKLLPKPRGAFSVSEKLARYGSSALSGVEHLALIVGKKSVALALIRHFGSLRGVAVREGPNVRQSFDGGGRIPLTGYTTHLDLRSFRDGSIVTVMSGHHHRC